LPEAAKFVERAIVSTRDFSDCLTSDILPRKNMGRMWRRNRDGSLQLLDTEFGGDLLDIYKGCQVYRAFRYGDRCSFPDYLSQPHLADVNRDRGVREDWTRMLMQELAELTCRCRIIK
jgi:hypothetical protein